MMPVSGLARSGLLPWMVASGCALLASSSVSAQEAPARGGDVVASAAGMLEYNAETFRDPMKSLLPTEPVQPAALSVAQETEPKLPPPQAEPEAPVATLEGMVWGGRFPQAIINGEVYSVGDTIDGALITAIDRGGVTVETSDAKFVISPSSGSPSRVRQIGQQTPGPIAAMAAGETPAESVTAEVPQQPEKQGGAQ